VRIAQVIEIEPAWMRPENACRYTDLPLEIIEMGIDDGHIEAVWIHSKRTAKRAIRLINRESLTSWIENYARLYGPEIAEAREREAEQDKLKGELR
jgi:hypothetical protein